MRIKINGEWAVIDEDVKTVSDLISYLDISPETIIIEKNNEILQKTEHSVSIVRNEDEFEIVTFVGGG